MICLECSEKTCSPHGCARYAQMSKQVKARHTAQNKPRSSKHDLFEYGGRTLTLDQWSQEYGINVSTLITRLRVGDSFEDAIKRPVKNTRPKLVEYNGVKKPLHEWCREYGINFSTCRDRLLRGYGIHDALTMPVQIKTENKETN